MANRVLLIAPDSVLGQRLPVPIFGGAPIVCDVEEVDTGGATGPTGPTGPNGPTGPTGATGATGATGPATIESFPLAVYEAPLELGLFPLTTYGAIILPAESRTVSRMRTKLKNTGGGAGNIDFAIYDAAFARLANGSVALAAGVVTANLSVPVVLAGGSVYYLGVHCAVAGWTIPYFAVDTTGNPDNWYADSATPVLWVGGGAPSGADFPNFLQALP